MGLKETAKWTFLHATPVGLTITGAKNMWKTVDYMLTPENIANATVNMVQHGTVIGTLKSVPNAYINAKEKVVKEELREAFAYSPITTIPYSMGEHNGYHDGKEDGVNEASSKYEEKIHDIKQNEIIVEEGYKKCIDGHLRLEDDYETENNNLREENDRLREELESIKKGK